MAKVAVDQMKSGFYWCDLHFRAGSNGSQWIKDNEDQEVETSSIKQEVLEFVADEYDPECGFWMRAGIEESYQIGNHLASIVPRHDEPLEVPEE